MTAPHAMPRLIDPRTLALGLIAAALFLLAPTDAHARRGLPLVVINTGDAIYEIGDLPAELAKDPELAGWKLGYKCQHFGVLWADIACWDKQLVAFKDDTYSDLPPDVRQQLEAAHPWSATRRNPWNKFGIFAMVGVAGLAFAVKRRS